MGDIRGGQAGVERATNLLTQWRGTPPYQMFGAAWEGFLADMRGHWQLQIGRYEDAEIAFRRADGMYRRAGRRAELTPAQRLNFANGADIALAWSGATMGLQGRIVEGSAATRQAILNQLRLSGRYSSILPDLLRILANLSYAQARYDDARRLTDLAWRLMNEMGASETSVSRLRVVRVQAAIATRERDLVRASEAYDKLDRIAASRDAETRERLLLSPQRVSFLATAGRTAEAVSLAERLVERAALTSGRDSEAYANALGSLGTVYTHAGRTADAIPRLREALAVLLDRSNAESDDIDVGGTEGRDFFIRRVIESFVTALSIVGGDVASEAFVAVENARGRSVQRALAAASTRAMTRDPRVATLVRREQELGQQVQALASILSAALSLPAAERDQAGIARIQEDLNRARADRTRTRAAIARAFPEYMDLIDPEAPTPRVIQQSLRDGEVFLSIYVGTNASFVWAVPRSGPVLFARVNANRTKVGALVERIRKGLDASVSTLLDLQAFDVEAAAELYQLFLKPVEPALGERGAIIATINGTLASLPLSLFARATAEVDLNADPMFRDYRKVPWLARTHSVVMVPSAASFRTLRTLPPGSQNREPFIGFGDPIFAPGQDEQSTPTDTIERDAMQTRGRGAVRLAFRNLPTTPGTEGVQFSQLQRLPDTADELKAVAGALGVSADRTLRLGRNANERIARSTDLTRFRIVAFATHGLVPGELAGLTEPALALTAPELARVDGDGLLTMSEILQMRLDADWVVLSACNTGAGAGEGAGAEAASGLGRAFFFAGTRAVLVTNWAVHSSSARELVSDLFKRQQDEPALPRAEALRRAMIALMDEAGIKGPDGSLIATYAHPVFWAPYTIMGDGGTPR